ncbi:MAG: LysM peptidoglycan-binding domain-containing protein [Firmicutes bacterium]|nr:LysM peptidoglycan-binding domain-containing protein [Bacillota bacterium]
MFYYMVAKGDSLWMIAKKFGVSLEAVIKANPKIKDPNKIAEGDRVAIPLEEEEGGFVYVVQSGDTMWAIAKKFGVSLHELILANPQVENADEIAAGMKIRIPKEGESGCAPTGAVNNGAVYVVKSGDTLFLIAQRYALNLDVLKAANPQIGEGETLKPGMQLYLPGFHHVKNGDTLSGIAKSYGVALRDLIAVNPALGDADRIAVGEKIAIPRRENGDIAQYAVKQGDTLYKIAQKYNISASAIMAANHDVISSDLIYPCQLLRIPGPHILTKGETLYGLGELYDVSLDDLMAANPALDDDRLAVGVMVKIPAAMPCGCRRKKEPFCGGVDYIVQSGDTMKSIAAMYRVPLRELLRANGEIKDPDRIRPGMVIHVPTGFVQCVCYVVQRGDSIWKIAAKYGLNAGTILSANPQLSDADRLHPGEVLMIPLGVGMWREEDEEPSCRAITYPEIYEVRDGDTLDAVAERFGTTVAQLRLANEAVKERDEICPGQQLIVLPADVVCEYRCLECPWLERGSI